MISFFNTPSSSNYVTEKEETLEEPQIHHCETGSLFGTEFGKLPNGRFLLINRAHFCKYKKNADGVYGYAKAEFDFTPDTWFFANHFHGDPVMPGTLQIEAVLQLAGLYLAWAGIPGVGRAREVGRTVFFDEVRPDNGSKFCFELFVTKIQGKGKLSFLAGSALGFLENGVRVMAMEGIKLIKSIRS
jgi:3-hydroxyacyl-[acyl-carrier protein] dehydratase/trans-2-decenoyl-[acyl-carrier protein] isomerase